MIKTSYWQNDCVNINEYKSLFNKINLLDELNEIKTFHA